MESSLKASIHMAKITGFVVDLVPLLTPLTQDEPCGPSLRYTDTFAQIKEARSEDDASLPMGEWVRPLKKADWRAVESLCVDALVCRSKDLQIAGWLTEAWIHLHGMDGFIAGTRLLTGLCQSYWQALHPLFEPDEADLRAAPFVWANDALSHTLLLHLPLLPWPDMVPPFINLDQWQRAVSHEFSPKIAKKKTTDEPPITRQAILDAAQSHLKSLAELDDSVNRAIDEWAMLTALLDDKLAAEAPSQSKVAETLLKIRQAIRSLLNDRDPRDAIVPQQEPPITETSPPVSEPVTDSMKDDLTPPPAPMKDAPVLSGPISSRAEAYQLLELVAAYLARTEPHSPTPYLVKRAVTWGRLPLPALMQEVMREEGDLSRYFSMLGIPATPRS
jgi:type VI secretion system protein ImpA